MSYINKNLSVAGKCIVVVGGTGKVGKCIVDSFLQRGATVVSVSRKKDNDCGYSQNLFDFRADVSTESGVDSVLEYISNKSLVPDVLVNAASFRPLDMYLSESVDKWDRFVSVNSRAAYLLLKKFADLMKVNKCGSLINISSIYAVVAPDPNLYKGLEMGTEPDYPFIKAGSLALTRYFASYYAEYGLRFNSIILGGVFNDQSPNFVKRYVQRVPLGRMAAGEDICGIVNLLASDASSYITGAEINVDGGFTIR